MFLLAHLTHLRLLLFLLAQRNRLMFLLAHLTHLPFLVFLLAQLIRLLDRRTHLMFQLAQRIHLCLLTTRS
jgi:hypothetical protein